MRDTIYSTKKAGRIFLPLMILSLAFGLSGCDFDTSDSPAMGPSSQPDEQTIAENSPKESAKKDDTKKPDAKKADAGVCYKKCVYAKKGEAACKAYCYGKKPDAKKADPKEAKAKACYNLCVKKGYSPYTCKPKCYGLVS